MRPVEIFVLEHALKYQMSNAVKAIRGRGNRQTLVYNLSSPYISLMYLMHVFKGYLSSSAATMSTWDPNVLKVIIDAFQDMFSRERFTSERTLVPLIMRTRLLEIIVYSEKSLPPGFVLEKLDTYFPKHTDPIWNKVAETYNLKGKTVPWLLDTCKKSRNYIMNLVIKKKRVENDLGDVQGFVGTVQKLADQVAMDVTRIFPQTSLEKIVAGEQLKLDKDTQQIIEAVINTKKPIVETHLLRLLELQETMEHPPVGLNTLTHNL